MYAAGIVLAVASALCNGTFGALAKTPRVQAAQVPPHVFNFWTCIGAALASSAMAAITGWRCLAPPALLSGCLFAGSAASAFLAIQLLGLSLAAGVWCGTAVLVSFGFGAYTEQPDLQWRKAELAVTALLLGITGIAASSGLHQRLTRAGRGAATAQAAGAAANGAESAEQLRPLLTPDEADGGAPLAAEEGSPLAAGGTPQPPEAAAAAGGVVGGPGRGAVTALGGLLVAVLTGVQGGLILAPMDFAGYQCRGIPFVPAMGVGVLLAALPVTLLAHWLLGQQATGRLPQQFAAAAAPGVASGVIWAAGNVCSILAVQVVGLAIAYPIMQCGLFVAGLWGIAVFGELRGALAPQLLYWGAGGVLVAGAALLALAGLPGG